MLSVMTAKMMFFFMSVNFLCSSPYDILFSFLEEITLLQMLSILQDRALWKSPYQCLKAWLCYYLGFEKFHIYTFREKQTPSTLLSIWHITWCWTCCVWNRLTQSTSWRDLSSSFRIIPPFQHCVTVSNRRKWLCGSQSW